MIRKVLKTFLLAGAMTLAAASTVLANFSWKVENVNSYYVGTATVTLKDWEGNTYQEEAPIIKSGAVVTFTEQTGAADYAVAAYDASGNPIHDFGGSGIAGGMKAGSSFQYTMNWETQRSVWNSTQTGQAGVFEITATGADKKVWQQKFIIDGACSSSILSNVKRTGAAADVYSWKSNSKGWWVEKADGSYMTNGWYQSPASGLWYYMGADGYMLTDTTTPDGYKVNKDGAWVK